MRWIDLDHPEPGELAGLAAVYGLHPLAVEDALAARDRPKLDRYESHRFLSAVTLADPGGGDPLALGRVMLFVGDAFVITVRQEDGDTLARARTRLARQAADGPEPGPVGVLHAVLATLVADLATVSDAIEDALLAVAERLFGPGEGDEAHALYRLTRRILALGHAVRPLVEPLRHLADPAAADLDVETSRRFADVLDAALVLDREVDDHTALLDHLRGSNDSRIGLQQNSDMRKIAAWAAVIAVPTAVTGFFGMNVPYPGFGEPSGLALALALQTVLAVALFGIFRRRDWL